MTDNLTAFLRVIREGETDQTDDAYRTLVGGGHFSDYSDHPRQRIYIDRLGVWSTAAGAYQFLARTWDSIARRIGLSDFSPKSQDTAAIELIRGRGALEDVVSGRFEKAIQKCNKEWASLPGSPYGQGGISMDRCKKTYEKYGGTYGMQKGKETTEEVIMNTNIFTKAAADVLSAIMPELQKIPEKALESVVKTAKDAVGAKNEQELVLSLSNPDSVKAVKEAVQAQWFTLVEAGSGGMKGASERSLMASERPLFKQPAFSITLLLLPLIYMTVGSVLWMSGWSDEVRVMVVSAIVSGVLGGILGFWLGTSFSSQKKTELMTR